MELEKLQNICTELRIETLEMIANAGSGHPGGSLSMMELLVALYYHQMNINPESPQMENRDRFVLSKGHGAPGLYAVLANKGYFDKGEMSSFRQLGSLLQGHPDKNKLAGVDASTGSLGQGMSIAVGMALGAKTLGNGVQVYTIVGDGELQEGQVWEAAMSAAHYNLNNLTVIVDNNGLQIDGSNKEVMDVGSIKAKFAAFGFAVQLIDGHDFKEILAALAQKTKKPRCIIAHTTKGKGVAFMEDKVGWHGRSPNLEELELAIRQLKGGN